MLAIYFLRGGAVDGGRHLASPLTCQGRVKTGGWEAGLALHNSINCRVPFSGY